MATIASIRTKPTTDGTLRLYQWTTLTEADTATPIYTPGLADKTVQVEGTFNGGTVVIEGSLMPSSPTYQTLKDAQGNALSLTAAGVRTVLENVYAIRPRVSAGTGVSVTVYLLAVGG